MVSNYKGMSFIEVSVGMLPKLSDPHSDNCPMKSVEILTVP